MKYLWFGIFLILAACSNAPVYHSTSYIPPATPGGRLCVDQCVKSHDFCHQSCDLDYRACYNSVQMQAQREYDAYARERFSIHQDVEMMPSDFEHPESCLAAKKNCLVYCDQPYDSCYRSCGGTLTVIDSCQFLCFQ